MLLPLFELLLQADCGNSDTYFVKSVMLRFGSAVKSVSKSDLSWLEKLEADKAVLCFLFSGESIVIFRLDLILFVFKSCLLLNA